MGSHKSAHPTRTDKEEPMLTHATNSRRQAARVATIAATAVIPLVVLGTGSGGAAPPMTEPTGDEETRPTLLPLAPASARVDLGTPVFSNPTTVDNPLFPISNLHSAVLVGNNEGHPIRIETALMPYTVTVDVDGQQVEALESQFLAFEDGRIVEVATDWYVQGDDGNVWYLGEDVFNYEDGVVADTDGTWMAGRDGAPAAMIMPADPSGGEVFRPENIPGVLIEEVTIDQVGITMDGPTGTVEGCIVARENHTLEGVWEDRWFCPGYGEFFSGVGDSLEGIGVAVPVDAAEGGTPPELAAIHDAAIAIVDAAADGDWDTVAANHDTVVEDWESLGAGSDVPPRLADQMNRDLVALAGDGLVPAADDHNVEGTENAALDVGHRGARPPAAVPPADRDRPRALRGVGPAAGGRRQSSRGRAGFHRCRHRGRCGARTGTRRDDLGDRLTARSTQPVEINPSGCRCGHRASRRSSAGRRTGTRTSRRGR
jgi:hypothetical protein